MSQPTFVSGFIPKISISPSRGYVPTDPRTVRSAPYCNLEGREARAVARRALDVYDIPNFLHTARPYLETGALRRRSATTLQVNIGLTCDLACRHCHVESSPLRKETMMRSVADRLIYLTERAPYIECVDITGGAPELHAEFRYLVSEMRARGKRVMDRCNLVVLEEEGQEDTVHFLAANNIKIVASMPCYSAANVEQQRGDGVFDASIRALQKLNAAGYATSNNTALQLDLVYNPVGASLPPAQVDLEAAYKRELKKAYGIEFNNLICITNMPIKRFADDLVRDNAIKSYLDLLVNSFNAHTLNNVMCLDMIHVAWDGTIYDCDFNYALAMSAALPPAKRTSSSNILLRTLPDALTVFDIDSWDQLLDRKIQTGNHCYGCTAGSGSSCGGSLA